MQQIIDSSETEYVVEASQHPVPKPPFKQEKFAFEPHPPDRIPSNEGDCGKGDKLFKHHKKIRTTSI